MSTSSVAVSNGNAQLPVSPVVVYTVPTGYRATVQKISVFNVDTVAAYKFSIWVALDGGANSNLNLRDERTIGFRQPYNSPLVGLAGLPAGTKIWCSADVASKLNFVMSIAETTV